MIKLKPPTHAIDGIAVFISSHDPAWDFERITAERVVRVDAALAAKQAAVVGADAITATLTPAETAAAVALSPVERYYAGKTRYQPDAPDWSADGKPTTARAYLRDVERPAEFGLRRLGFRAFQEVAALDEPRARLVEACRLGLRSITADGHRWRATGDGPAPDEQIEVLHTARPDLVTEIGAAVILLSRALDSEAETPR